jgi:hypothetical protein
MPGFRGGTPAEVEVEKCLDIARAWNKLQEFSRSWSKLMVDIRVRSCCHDELLDDETPLENAVTTHKKPVAAKVSFGEDTIWV